MFVDELVRAMGSQADIPSQALILLLEPFLSVASFGTDKPTVRGVDVVSTYAAQ